ncbi:MAG: alpha/beta fold hydrolase [Panacibacter sp.]
MKQFFKRTAYIFLSGFIFFNIICAVQAYHFTRFVDHAVRQNPREMGLFEKTGAVLFGMPVPKSKVVDSFHVPHTNVRITTEDGLHLAGWSAIHTTESVSLKGTILMFHGHGSCRSGMTKEAEAFYGLGWNILTVDFRNHGESEGTTCSVGYNEAKDVKAVYDFAVANGAKNIVLFGVSMGAATITKAMHDYLSMQPQKIILEMSFGTMHDAVDGFVRVMHLPDEPLGTFLAFWGSAELGIWSFSNKPVEYAKDIHCKVLLQWGKEDYRVQESETDEIYANLGTDQKTLVKYDHSGHQSLCKNEHDKWIQNVTAFLNK